MVDLAGSHRDVSAQARQGKPTKLFIDSCKAAHPKLFDKYSYVDDDRIAEVLVDVSMDEDDADATLLEAEVRTKPPAMRSKASPDRGGAIDTTEVIIQVDSNADPCHSTSTMSSDDEPPRNKMSGNHRPSHRPGLRTRGPPKPLTHNITLAQEAAHLLEDAGDFIVSNRRRKRSSQLATAAPSLAREQSTDGAKQGLKPTTAPRPRKPPRGIYIPEDDEVLESEQLEVVGEEQLDGTGVELPCRVLDNFVIYDMARGNQLISLEAIGQENRDVTASGDVEPIFTDSTLPEVDDDEDDDEDEDDCESENAGVDNDTDSTGSSRGRGKAAAPRIKPKRREAPKQRIRLSAVFYYQEQYLDSGLSTIWLRTTFAWYKLCRPMTIYERHYRAVFQPVRITNLVISWAFHHRQGTYQDFVDALPSISTMGVASGCAGSSNIVGSDAADSQGNLDGPDTSVSYLSRHDYHLVCTERMLKAHMKLVCAEFEAWCEQGNDFSLIETPLMRHLLQQRFEKTKDMDEADYAHADTATRRTNRAQNRSTKRPENPATVTPHINSIAKGLFKKNILAVRTNRPDLPLLILNSQDVVLPTDSADLAASGVETLDDTVHPVDDSTPAAADNAQQHQSYFVTQPQYVEFGGSRQRKAGQRCEYYETAKAQFGNSTEDEATLPMVSSSGENADSDDDDEPSRRVARNHLLELSQSQDLVCQTVRLYDCVYVCPSTSAKKPNKKAKAGRTNGPGHLNKSATYPSNSPLIVMVTRLYYDSFTRRKLFHGRVFMYGRETLLNEVASPHELFLTDQCKTFDLMHDFRGLCPVKHCTLAETDTSVLGRFGIYDGLYYRFWYDPHSGSFEDVEQHMLAPEHRPQDPAYCPTCCRHQCTLAQERPCWLVKNLLPVTSNYESVPTQSPGLCLQFQGHEYHLGDFVYIIPDTRGVPYRIGQIVGFSPANQWGVDRELSMAKSGPKAPKSTTSSALHISVTSDSNLSGDSSDADDGSFDGNFQLTIPAQRPSYAKNLIQSYTLPGHPSTVPRMHVRIREFIRMDEIARHLLPISERTFVSIDPKTHKPKRPVLASNSDYAQSLDGTPEQNNRAAASSTSNDTPTADSTPFLRFPVKDSRHLYATHQYFNVEPTRLEGKCWVEHIDHIDDLEAYKGEDTDAFYVEFQTTLRGARTTHNGNWTQFQPFPVAQWQQCAQCRVRRTERLQHRRQLLAAVSHAVSAKKQCKLSMQPTSRLDVAPGSQPASAKLPSPITSPKTVQMARPLVAMDIFSGCGGLTVGMEASGIVETKYAVEFMPSAALTFEKNNPGATVYNQCANLLLASAIAEHANHQPRQQITDFMGRPLSSMPAPGEVDFIYCGPPCQGFSGINRFPKADDIKNTLIATSLSYVDFYRPRYFLLENVRGMLQFRLGGSQTGATRVTGGIEFGVLKFIMRALTSMGYQVRFSVQQAGCHGVPQTRRRLFVWGARRGHRLPQFPQPITCFTRALSVAIKLPNGVVYSTSRRSQEAAPHYGITVQDAISDLPAFEYVNPERVYKVTDDTLIDLKTTDMASAPVLVGSDDRLAQAYEETRLGRHSSTQATTHPWMDPLLQLLLRTNFVAVSHRGTDRVRQQFLADIFDKRSPTNSPTTTEPASTILAPINRRILQWPVPKSGYVGIMDQPYQCPPLTQYQRERRYLAERLQNHVTRCFNELTVERICRIPMEPGADHSALPDKLKPWCLSAAESAANRHNGWKGLFGRLDFNSHFLTALTSIQPMGKAGTVIHPTQHRVISVRECARAQGFPDHFVFLSEDQSIVNDMHRQVGNAVPPPLSHALSKQLVEAVLDDLLTADPCDQWNSMYGQEPMLPTANARRVDPSYYYGMDPALFRAAL
ncbi:hypothetical protein H4R34_001360 [Dimargaris verticillata]|uniref:DNA (cytosine-5-)-methyltransferase n=1 Tax=Dimargaris verticillata TaxID=2761393 RepID=A0A9W8B8N9_9FUNG|nr:hypothetical protein H4R34_001360 [Dimargaris verticillata]